MYFDLSYIKIPRRINMGNSVQGGCSIMSTTYAIASHTPQFFPRTQGQNPSTPAIPLPPSRSSASFRRTSALNFLKAASILTLLSGSLDMVRLAEALPVRRPVSPPKKRPPVPKKKYVATSPSVVGLRTRSRSAVGMASTHGSQPSASNRK